MSRTTGAVLKRLVPLLGANDTRPSGRPPQPMVRFVRRLPLVTCLVFRSLAALLHHAALQHRPDRLAPAARDRRDGLPSRRGHGRELTLIASAVRRGARRAPALEAVAA
jgi:hypothetical protein